MTTIAYRNGVLAADSGVWIGEAALPFARKLAKGKSGTLYGVSGSAAEGAKFIAWVEAGEIGDCPRGEAIEGDRSSFIAIAVAATGQVRLIVARGDEIYEAPYFAIGAGNVGALCALYAGADAIGAVEAAIAHAPGAMAPIQSISHGKD